MERKVVVVSVIVGFFILLSAVLGFAAEGKRIKASDVEVSVPGECIYPKSPALFLGLSSVVALIIAQAIISSVAGCICCRPRTAGSSSAWTVGLISFILSWITFVAAFLLLLTGTALNDQRGVERMYFGNYCYVVKPGVFSSGAVLAFISGSLGLVYYLSLVTNKQISPQVNEGVAMVNPQSSQPVFVHEDTYNRQQNP
ncbi:protein MODIFYING WALL LIGNIN-1-like [Wolffia australiana]